MPPTQVANLQVLALILFRLLAVFLLAPVLSVRSVPVQFKIGLALFLSIVIWSGMPAVATPLELLPFAAAAVRETVIGAVIGFVAHLVTATAEVAGGIIDMQTGFLAGMMMNPLTAASSSVLEQLYFLLATLVFLALDGHHILLLALVRTFEVLPAGAAWEIGSLAAGRLAALTSGVLITGCSIALPVLAVTLLLDVVLAILARTVPQIQVFFVGLPVKIGLGLAMVLLTLPGTVYILRKLVGGMPAQIAWLVGAL